MRGVRLIKREGTYLLLLVGYLFFIFAMPIFLYLYIYFRESIYLKFVFESLLIVYLYSLIKYFIRRNMDLILIDLYYIYIGFLATYIVILISILNLDIYFLKEISGYYPYQTVIILLSLYIFSYKYFIDGLLDTLKSWLIEKIVEVKNINIFVAESSFWYLRNPRAEKYIYNNKIVEEKESNFFIIPRLDFDKEEYEFKDRYELFEHIYNLIVCSLLSNGDTTKQKYFHILFATLIILNNIIFLTVLITIKFLLNTNYSYNLTLVLLIVILITAVSLATVLYFIKHIHTNVCKKEIILANLRDSNAEYIDINENNIDKYYFVFNKKEQFNCSLKLKELDEVNSALLSKIDSIYQITTPIIFAAQITIALACIINCR